MATLIHSANSVPRVAVIAVHGIADPPPGQTAREVARLLCQTGTVKPRYLQGEVHGVLIPVTELGPGGSPLRTAGRLAEVSDFREGAGAPSGFFQSQVRGPAPFSSAAPSAHDLGIAFDDYLLDRLQLSAQDSLYESTRVSLQRRSDTQQVDVYELYWADLSRLGAGSVRALSALYQLFFHLGTLAADIVDQVSLVRGVTPAWALLQRLHAWAAWLLKSPAMAIQLSMLLVVASGALGLVPPQYTPRVLATLFGTATLALALSAPLFWLHGASQQKRGIATACTTTAALACLAATFLVLSIQQWLGFIYFGVSILACGVLGAIFIERYAQVTAGVRLAGHAIVLLTALGLALYARRELPHVTTMAEWMLGVSLHVGEWLLAALLVVWAGFVALQLVALPLGLWLGRQCDRRIKASLHTARLALVLSTGLLAVLSLVLWSLVSYLAGLALNDIRYEPLVFEEGFWPAASFLEARVRSVGGFFTPLVFAFTLLAGAVLLVLAPSLMQELLPTKNFDAGAPRADASDASRRLGHWLAAGTRRLNHVFVYALPLGAMTGSVLYLAFVIQQFTALSGAEGSLARGFAEFLAYFQGATLVTTGKWLATAAVVIAFLGAHFTNTFGRLRIALDAVLDIDNYFNDPRHRQPPRARIYARFTSLLRYLRTQNYARIVIVAHSQGTVISADLLHYLYVQQRLPDVVGEIPLALVTVGSPLRNLYAERFPLLYGWMGTNEPGFAGATPNPAILGVTEWVNACRAGDYVGQFIWTPETDPARHTLATLSADGSVHAQRAGRRTEFCLGVGGHTHYFDDDAVALAIEIERLITQR